MFLDAALAGEKRAVFREDVLGERNRRASNKRESRCGANLALFCDEPHK